VSSAARTAGFAPILGPIPAVGARVVGALVVGVLAGCAGGDTRPDGDAGTFRLTNALQGETVALAPEPVADALPRLRMVASDDAADPIAHWRLTAFGQGLYRVSSVEAAERLSLASGYRDAGVGATIGNGELGAVGLDLSRKSLSQLWQVVPLGEGDCRLVSALFPNRSLGVASVDAGEPLLAASEDVPAQRWRLVAADDEAADGLPALCSGQPLPG